MAPASGLTALLNSPAPSSTDSTIIANGKTLPDVSLGSLGSSFRSEDHEDGWKIGRTPVARAPNLPPIISPETSQSTNIATPSPVMPHAALMALSPPINVRRSHSHSALPDQAPGSQAPRRSRILRRSSASSASSSDVDGPLKARYGEATDDEETNAGVLSALSISLSPAKPNGLGKSYGGPSKRGGRHSVAADTSGTGPLTLRDQEQQLNAAKKDIFNLQLENHFLKERLANMAPDHIEAALKENVKLKLEILNLSKEMKKVKKLLLQQDKDLAEAQREREGGRGGRDRDADSRELEAMYKAEKERRKAAEKKMEERTESSGKDGDADLQARLEDTEASERVWQRRAEGLEDELEGVKVNMDDQAEELDRLRDAADRAEDEVERLKAGLGESVGTGRGREARMLAKLEQENASLQAKIEAFQKGEGADVEELEDQINELRDKLAAAQLDVDRRDAEIEQLNDELDTKVRDHDTEVQQVEADWRDEVLEARAQVDELKDVLESREQDMKEIREALMEREDDLAAAADRIAELQNAQAETHDRLEETLQNIERDNAEKDADLIAANHEVDALGQRVYDLEEACEDLRRREQELNVDLKSADEAFDSTKQHYENLVTALKDARRKLQDERDDVLTDAREVERKMLSEKEALRKEMLDEVGKLTRALTDKEQVNSRLQNELDAARDRVTQRDRDLNAVHSNLRSLESEKHKLGSEQTTNRFDIQLEIDRVKRDLAAAEDNLARAKADVSRAEDQLRLRDLEKAEMLDKQRDLESRLASERQGRLNLSDKLDLANKNARQHERDAANLRERIEELEPLLTETQQERFQIQRQSEQQRQDRSELLLRVFKAVNSFLGTDDHTTPANFSVFRDTLVTRLRSMNNVRSDFEKRIKETEASVDQRMGALKKQLEQKWRAVDTFETSVKKLELTKMQWKSKYSIKEGELEAAKARNTDLSQQLSGIKAGSSSDWSAAQRGLKERAEAAEKRAQNATNQLSQLEAKLAEVQLRAGSADDKWAARVKEYENRLRIAGEKIKTEKQGGKERARQLEEQVRQLEQQVEQARRRNTRAEGVVATAAHLL